jgi:hypothetical protein
MIPLVLAATLAGVTLGSNLTQVLAEHPGAQRSANIPGRRWVWSRSGGGTVAVTADDSGRITRVFFLANKGQHDNIDVPCVPAFPVEDSDANLQSALRKTGCSAFNGATYGVPDRSLVAIRFDGPGGGQLIEATWYRPSAENPSPVGHLDAVARYLRPALTYFGGVARIYYAGECRATDTTGRFALFPPAVALEPRPAGVTGLNAVRQIFADDPSVTVTQDRSGMLRIVIGSVSTAILQTRIQTLTLNPSGPYSAISALVAIENVPELHAAERRLNVYGGLEIINFIVSGPIPGAPHLPTSIKNVTVDEAFDLVARTFKGIATYGICTQPDGKGLLRFGFIDG